MKGLARSLARKASNKGFSQAVQVAAIRIDKTIAVSAVSSAVGFGTGVIGDFPEGNVLFLGAVSYLTFTGPTSADLADTWDGDYSIGTAPTADVTLSGAEVNIIGSTALGAATAEVSPKVRGALTTAAIFDNTDGSLELNLNLLVDAANIADDSTVNIRAQGVVYIAYAIMGDD